MKKIKEKCWDTNDGLSKSKIHFRLLMVVPISFPSLLPPPATSSLFFQKKKKNDVGEGKRRRKICWTTKRLGPEKMLNFWLALKMKWKFNGEAKSFQVPINFAFARPGFLSRWLSFLISHTSQSKSGNQKAQRERNQIHSRTCLFLFPTVISFRKRKRKSSARMNLKTSPALRFKLKNEMVLGLVLVCRRQFMSQHDLSPAPAAGLRFLVLIVLGKDL